MSWPRTSSIERKMAEAFKAIGLSPVPQFTIDWYIVDFAFPDEKLVVECDGVYWHGRPSQQIKDRRKDKYLKSKGWKMIRLGEIEINASPETCAAIVQEHLSSYAQKELCPTARFA
jgi:very-short-patch-repair endonuclease